MASEASKTPFPKSNVSRISDYNCLPEELVLPSSLTGRAITPDFMRLVHSIVQLGQLQPIIVRQDGGKIVVVAGFTRVTAIAYINEHELMPDKKPLMVRCTYRRGEDEKSGFLAAIHENHYRNPTQEIDDIENIQKLLTWGRSEAEIAETYGESVAWVKARVKLTTLAPEAKAAVRDGKMKMSRARQIAKLSNDLQRKAVKEGGKVPAEAKAEEGPKLPSRGALVLAVDSFDGPGSSDEIRAFVKAFLKFANGKTEGIKL